MVVLSIEHVPASLRGELSRWLIEPRPGVFVGTVNAMVRDRLWKRLTANPRCGAAVMMHAADTEQGYAVRMLGQPTRAPVNFDGLVLIRSA